MDSKSLHPDPRLWIHVDGHLTITRGADGAYTWKSDSHPAMSLDDVLRRVRSHCEKLEQAVQAVDATLRLADGASADVPVDDLLDRRSGYTDQLRALREFLQFVAGVRATE